MNVELHPYHNNNDIVPEEHRLLGGRDCPAARCGGSSGRPRASCWCRTCVDSLSGQGTRASATCVPMYDRAGRFIG